MSTETLRRLVASAEYKPGWDLSVRIMHDRPHVLVTAKVPDSEPPHTDLVIGHVLPVPAEILDADDDHQRRWVLDAVLAVERHETREWLRFDGKVAYPPYHGEDGDPYGEPE